jgi:hypothetical protein
MTNVVALDLGYDVPVKPIAISMLLMAGRLVWPDVPRLAKLLLAEPAPPSTHPWLKPSFLLCVLPALVFGRSGRQPPLHSELAGIWQADSGRLRRMILDSGWVELQWRDGAATGWRLADCPPGSLSLKPLKGGPGIAFRYKVLGDQLELSGAWLETLHSIGCSIEDLSGRHLKSVRASFIQGGGQAPGCAGAS